MIELKRLSALVLLCGLFSCENPKKSDAVSNDVGTEAASNDAYIPTEIPDDVTKLIVDLTEGDDYDEGSVLLICQGGPMPMLLGKEEVIDHILEYNKKYKTYNVHQAQTYNTDLFTNNLTFEEITKESKTSIDILHKVITHFKGEGKKVYLYGSSFGFFVIENYIANYGTDHISGAVMGNGRLDMNEVVWKAFSRGEGYAFDDKGINPVPDGEGDEEEGDEEDGPGGPEEEMMLNPDWTEEQKMNLGMNIARMAAGLGQYRHTALLADKDLSKVIVYYGEIDRIVGTLTKDEVKFLTETLAPEKRPKVIKGIGLGHGQKPEEEHEKGNDYTQEIMEGLFSK